jgi:CRP/FNR family cyclic AMP-dependent transcriptional regulator
VGQVANLHPLGSRSPAVLMERKLWYLKRCDLFERLTPEQAARLERRALMRSFPRGTLIYAPTEPGQCVLVLVAGRVKIKDVTADGKESILTFIDEGELFGELAIVDDRARQEYAEAVTDAQVLAIPREDLLALMEQRPDIALSITKLVGLRRRRIENRFRNVLFLPSRERLVRLLLELMEAHGDRSGNSCSIRLPLSHQELASLIGVTRETVTVVLGQLQAEGLIRVKRRRLVVTDCRRLLQQSTAVARPAEKPRARPAR